MNYIYEICKIFKIKDKNVAKSLINFKGLNHRHEIFTKIVIKLLLMIRKQRVFNLVNLL